jgi:hypothetical protein
LIELLHFRLLIYNFAANKLLDMMKYLHILLATLIFASCSLNDPPEVVIENESVEQTVIMFYPWSGLKSYFVQNISDISDAVKEYGNANQRVIVCIESTPGEADIINLKYKNGTCQRDTLRHINNPQLTTVDGMTSMFNTITEYSPSDKYSLIIGCHGLGWIPVEKTTSAKARSIVNEYMYECEFMQDGLPQPITRWFGGESATYQIEISDLAQAISNTGLKFEYILFDACYMSTVEVAYDLRNATHYLIASPTEILSYGIPYKMCGKYLLNSSDYDLICQEFYNFYIDYKDEYGRAMPFGTLAVIDCTELDKLAERARAINTSEIADFKISSVQRMDKYSKTIFYDLADLMEHKATDATLLDDFLQQLDKAVPYKTNTSCYYDGTYYGTPINTYCGITTSEYSSNDKAAKLSETAWYQATH